MFILYWPLVIFVTLVLYALMVISLPFSEVYATVFLFAIISFWSRLPGVGMYSPFYILYIADFVDFFSLIVAVNIGGIPGAMFTLFANFASRACGMYPSWLAVSKDAFSQALTCLIIPFIHVATGSDIFMSMMIYSVLRILWLFPMRLLPTETSFPQFLFLMFSVGSLTLIINAIYAKFFGNFFDTLLTTGVQFNWLIFAIVTVVIIISKYTLFGKSKSKADPIVMKTIRKLFYGKNKKKTKRNTHITKSNHDPRRFI